MDAFYRWKCKTNIVRKWTIPPSILLLFEHIPVPVKLYNMESVLRPVVRFSDPLNFMVSVDDIDDALNVTKQLYAKPFFDNREDYNSLRWH